MKASRQFVAGLALGLMLSASVAYAASFTITVAPADVSITVDAWSLGLGWRPETGLTKVQFALARIDDMLTDRIRQYQEELIAVEEVDIDVTTP